MDSAAIKQGGAPALPSAQAFIATGGRLMLDPNGELMTAADLARVFGADNDAKEARRGFVAARRFARRLRDPRFARSVATLVAMDGQRTATGWLVLEGRA